MTKLLSVVETPAYPSKASKLLNDQERAAVVDADLTNDQRTRLAAVANALLTDFGGRR